MSVKSTIGSNLPPGSKSKLPKIEKMGAGGVALNALFFVPEFVSGVKEGKGVAPSLAKAAGSMMVNDIMFGMLGPVGGAAMIAGTVAMGVGGVAINAGKQNAERIGGAIGSPNMKHKQVINSANAQTMRQRGMAMINQNGETTRSVFGSEARAYFRSNMY